MSVTYNTKSFIIRNKPLFRNTFQTNFANNKSSGLNTQETNNLTFSLVRLSFRQLILSDFHIGDSLNTFDNLNYHFIFGRRHENYIINLQFTLFNLKSALFFLTNLTSRRGKVLFVDGHNNRNLVGFYAKTSRQFFCNHKWISGTLTNFKHFYTAVYDGESRHFYFSPKSGFGVGFRYMHRPPNAICILDLPVNFPALLESVRMGIPSISLVNTGTSISGITFPIFSNTSSIDAGNLFLILLRSAILNGYRFEIYRFFRESLKSVFLKRFGQLKREKLILDTLFRWIQARLFAVLYRFFFVLVNFGFLTYNLALITFIRGFFFGFFYLNILNRQQLNSLMKIGNFEFGFPSFIYLFAEYFLSVTFKKFQDFFFFVDYFVKYILYNFIIVRFNFSQNVFILDHSFLVFNSILYDWFYYRNLFFKLHTLYFEKSPTIKQVGLKTFLFSYNNMTTKLLSFRFINRFFRFKSEDDDFRAHYRKGPRVFRALKLSRIYSKLPEHSFLFFRFRSIYRKFLFKFSRFFRAAKMRLRFFRKYRKSFFRFMKLLKQNPKKFKLLKLPKLPRLLRFFSLDDYIFVRIFREDRLYGNSHTREWRLLHRKFRLFFSSLFLIADYFRAEYRRRLRSLPQRIHSRFLQLKKRRFIFIKYISRNSIFYTKFINKKFLLKVNLNRI
jgi:small subunit ribosomal protein S2